jgi:hypothetical protein
MSRAAQGGRTIHCAGGTTLLKLGSVEHARIAIEVMKALPAAD